MKEKNGVKAYKSHLPDNALYAFKGEGVINAPIEQVLSILLDAKRATEWVPKLSACKIIDDKNWPLKFTQYSNFNAPWPVKDRFFISTVKLSINTQEKEVIISYTNERDLSKYPNLDTNKKAIHGSIEGSHYKLKSNNNRTSTYFTAISIVQPYGKIPTWLINWAGSNMPFDTMKRLNKQLQKEDIYLEKKVNNLLATF